MRVDVADVLELGARMADQAVADVVVDLAGDRWLVECEQIPDGMDTAGQRVFYRCHAIAGLAFSDGLEELIEGETGLNRDPILLEVGGGG